jgi:hypothetical protein
LQQSFLLVSQQSFFFAAQQSDLVEVQEVKQETTAMRSSVEIAFIISGILGS